MRPTVDGSRVRYSAPFFYNPNYDAVVRPVNFDCVDEAGREGIAGSVSVDGSTGADTTTPSSDKLLYRYAPIRWGDYRNSRFQGDFKDVGEEIQIEHFQA